MRHDQPRARNLSFGQLIEIAYVSDSILDSMNTELKIVLDVRNYFAHKWEQVSFNDEYAGPLPEKLPFFYDSVGSSYPKETRHRLIFFGTCGLLVTTTMNIASDPRGWRLPGFEMLPVFIP